ncbi:MAG: VOC family protein [Actinobacteria bacterium]|nr:VOC family protein [Actinomycetota bacterium]MBO0834021.1 VOC family protein [Actinomycetota bacterium]
MAKSSDAGVTLGRIASTISVTNMSRALGLYRDLLGMRVVFTNGDPIGFLILKRDAAELHLTLAKQHRAGTQNVAHLMVNDASGLYDHLVAHGVKIIKGLRDADYGLRGFVFADPDGNRIDVGQALDAEPYATVGLSPGIPLDSGPAMKSAAVVYVKDLGGCGRSIRRAFRCRSWTMPATTA